MKLVYITNQNELTVMDIYAMLYNSESVEVIEKRYDCAKDEYIKESKHLQYSSIVCILED